MSLIRTSYGKSGLVKNTTRGGRKEGLHTTYATPVLKNTTKKN